MDEEEYEVIESRLFMAVVAFENEWDKAWNTWRKTHDIPADMPDGYPYDEEGFLLPEAEEWNATFADIKTRVEKEYGCDITVDTDGEVFAIHHLPDGDTVTVP